MKEFLKIGLTFSIMCHANRGKRGGRVRRINVIVSNRDFSFKSLHKDRCNSNLIEVPLSVKPENSIEVIISDRPDELIRPSKQTEINRSANLSAVRVQTDCKSINVSVLNLQSACNKVDQISDFIQESRSDILFLSETWISENNNHTCDQFTPLGYTTHHIPRKGRQGGGVAIVTNNALRGNPIKIAEYHSFEHAIVRIKSKDSYITAVTLYRPPGHVSQQFLTEFTELLETISLSKDRVLVCGDFNIHVDNPTDTSVQKFMTILNEFGLSQHTQAPTHTSGHTLDLVITRSNDDLLRNTPTASQLFSDHFAIEFQCNLDYVCESARVISFRKIKKIDVKAFESDISDLSKDDFSSMDTETLLNLYDSTLISALDKHAPLTQKTIKSRVFKPWLDEEVLAERRKRRQLERIMRKNKSNNNISDYKIQNNLVNRLIDRKKISFFNAAIEKCNGDQKGIYILLRKLTNRPTKPVFPDAPSDKDLAELFSHFFESKIDKINAQFSDTPNHEHSNDTNSQLNCNFAAFPPITQEELRKYIMQSPTKSCQLDPIPTFLLKECIDTALPILTETVNRCLTSGHMPPRFKRALLSPIPKKPKIPHLKNFRPISNLPFVSKVIERIVIDKLSTYCANHNLDENYQSAYRKHHSCETALLEVANVILTNMDNQQVTLLTLLDLSAAFDTVPHRRFLKRLESDYGITNTALKWFESYFENRQQTVIVNGAESAPKALSTGMPQGSGTGPWGYTKYTGPLGALIRLMCILYHMFADDTKLHTALNPCSKTAQFSAKDRIEKCISAVSSWMTANRLKLNSDKTEFIMIGTKRQLAKMNFGSITIDNETIKSRPAVRILGVIFDSEMKMNAHVTQTVRKCYGKIREIASIRRYITFQVAQTLVQSMVMSHLDYGNSLLYGISEHLLTKLQRVQNAAARVILGYTKYDHITPGLVKLHWLPIKYRILFKIAMITYKVLSTNQPKYLRQLLVFQNNKRSLRSGNENLLKVPKTKLKTAGDRSFALAAPTIWNSLPKTVKEAPSLPLFKKELKTYYFRSAYKDFL